MSKEKLMQFLSNAIDNGANINILFYGHKDSKQTAEKRIKEFSEIIGVEKIVEHENGSHKWFRTENQFTAGMSHFYGYLEEDVDLSGGEEIVS